MPMRAPDLVLLEDRLRLRGIPLGTPLVVLDEVTSTNDLAKRAAKEGAPHGATFLAESQTAGRGRQGRTWSSPSGQNLLVSVLLRTPCPLARLPQLSLVAGLAIRDAVARALGEPQGAGEGLARVLVKWPNDVLVRGLDQDAVAKKVAGILVESTLSGSTIESIVVGFGINVHVRDFPEDLAERATSVALSGGDAPDRVSILLDVLEGLGRDVPRVAARGLGDVHERLTRFCALRGRPIDSSEASGTCEGIDRDGRLVVRTEHGALVRLSSGEVHIGTSRTPRAHVSG